MSAIGSAWSSALERVTGTAVAGDGGAPARPVPQLPEPFKELQPAVARMPLFATYTGVAPGQHERGHGGEATAPQADGNSAAATARARARAARAIYLSVPMQYVYTLVGVFLLSFILLLLIRPRFLYTTTPDAAAPDEGSREALSAGKAAAYAGGAVGLAALIMGIMAIVGAVKKHGAGGSSGGGSATRGASRRAHYGGSRRSRRRY